MNFTTEGLPTADVSFLQAFRNLDTFQYLFTCNHAVPYDLWGGQDFAVFSAGHGNGGLGENSLFDGASVETLDVDVKDGDHVEWGYAASDSTSPAFEYKVTTPSTQRTVGPAQASGAGTAEILADKGGHYSFSLINAGYQQGVAGFVMSLHRIKDFSLLPVS